jgi:aminodeoxyfutalosine deaminase
MPTYTARWIFPVASPLLERGTITITADKIAVVEPHGARTPDVDLGNVAILPGFVNTHTHLDLTGARGLCPPTPDFTQWLRSVIAFRRSRAPEQVQADIAAGLAECLRFGTTLIGDISAGGPSWDAVSKASCRAIVFYELLGLTEERAEQAWRVGEKWLHQCRHTDRCVGSLSVHAPYSAHKNLYTKLKKHTVPVATHLAETPAELELLRSHTGPYVDFLKEMNVWYPSGLIHDPREVIDMWPRGLFVHGNYLDPATTFPWGQQSVVVCPRTHAAFGHPHHPFPKMNVRVALGTDSLASNPDLDILAEARCLRRHYPEVEPAVLLRMLTLNGAEALGFHAVTGSLTPGKSADLVVLPLPNVESTDPHDLILDSTLPIQRAMFRGTWRI